MYKKSMIAASCAAIVFGGCSNVTDELVKDWDKVENKVKPLVHLLESNKEPTPDLKPIKDVKWADQNWNYDQQKWFWHIPQGTMIMPYDWFISLEQPENDGNGLFTDPVYMARFGFIPSEKTKMNPDSLPIGFVKDEKFFNPMDGTTTTVAGITCAACHTGEINYNGKGLLIDGGSAMIDVTLFQDKLAVSLAETLLIGDRFDKFAKRVLKENYSSLAKGKLKEAFANYAKESAKYSNAMIVNDLNKVKEGFGRVDALTRIGNVVFGAQLDLKNIRAIAAPVSYPPIWDVPWFDWAQYNGSIRQPMVRNVGEALGVQALINLTGKSVDQFKSSVHVDNLHKIEELLAGDTPFSGLSSPQWPEDILGPLDSDKIKQGKVLFDKHCVSCHLPPVGDKELMKPKYWEKKANKYGKKYLKTHNIPLDKIGTDAAEVTDFYNRRADTGPLGLGTQNANDGLKVVTEAVANKWYKDHGITDPKQIAKMDGYRENKVLRPLKYRARPLNGIWSTPPFLHNGSVLNIYELLSPEHNRSTTFYVGTKEFDPVKLGYENKNFKGAFLMDTTIQGNDNSGHLFDDLTESNKDKGVIGPKLTEDEKWNIIEYLKSI